MTSPSDLKDSFFLECEDLLEEMAQGLRELGSGEVDPETVNSVFRAVHSIKGGAGAFKLTKLVDIAHCFETVMEELRNERLRVTPDNLKLLMRAGDHLTDMVAIERDGEEQDDTADAALKTALEALLPEPDTAPADDLPAFQPTTLNIGQLPGLPDLPTPTGTLYEIVFRPTAALYESGNEPSLLLRELAELGEMQATLDASEVPPFAELDPSESYLTWTIKLTTDAGEEAIREVFEFVETTCELTITDGDTLPPPAPPPPLAPPEPEAHAPAAAPEASPTVSATVEQTSRPAPTPAPRTAPKPAARQHRPTIRVDLERVDKLINIVGELIIHQAMLTQAVEESEIASGSDITTALDDLKQLSRDIQESVMAIRAQPVKPLFERMYRIIREAGEAAGKSVRLETDGEMTEVDKTVVERLADPLTHMVRNAVDHGLESTADRLAAGKPEEGVIRLSAAHRSGRVLITITDDGGGINRERVFSIAAEKGLIEPDAELTETEIDNLLFLPGFSTASEVSSLSGRGVGMDVVKSAVQTLGGRISISSTPGAGTSFSISLPLTLAVLDGMVVTVAEQQMVVPITMILETLRLRKEDLMALGPDSTVVGIRGTYIPIIDVGAVLGFREPLEDMTDRVALLVETEDDTRAAFMVDNIFDQRQVVIKSLQKNYGEVPGVAAATVFGNGRVALIIDPPDLMAEASKPAGGALPLGDDAAHAETSEGVDHGTFA